ncbi:UNKNOWN [Stylonychia lemnae]|uniref:Uncharacterized protein n=1 Tax=Stylonychia lemnae TaxID=5949 RepID=A0A078AXK6_STYLE|nr:UNKNOWN [Stylonychia lemnae]|eukprot:CDW85972.1 UNKNOWN [Stylonychia lemnae]
MTVFQDQILSSQFDVTNCSGFEGRTITFIDVVLVIEVYKCEQLNKDDYLKERDNMDLRKMNTPEFSSQSQSGRQLNINNTVIAGNSSNLSNLSKKDVGDELEFEYLEEENQLNQPLNPLNRVLSDRIEKRKQINKSLILTNKNYIENMKQNGNQYQLSSTSYDQDGSVQWVLSQQTDANLLQKST